VLPCWQRQDELRLLLSFRGKAEAISPMDNYCEYPTQLNKGTIMNINLTFQSADYEFIVEAIKLRTTAILEAMSMQYDSQMIAANTAPDIEKQRKDIEQVIQFEKELAEWELTQQGNKVTATHKPKTRKSKAAPYGYKKDGTPKKRPGRPVGF
jgi:hypothetical protein